MLIKPLRWILCVVIDILVWISHGDKYIHYKLSDCQAVSSHDILLISNYKEPGREKSGSRQKQAWFWSRVKICSRLSILITNEINCYLIIKTYLCRIQNDLRRNLIRVNITLLYRSKICVKNFSRPSHLPFLIKTYIIFQAI